MIQLKLKYMKRNNGILIALLLLFGLFTIISCTKDSTTFTTYGAFTQPAATSPTVRADGTVLITGPTVNLTWTSESAGHDPVSWNVYYGTGKKPALYKSGVTSSTLAVPVLDGQTYYWKVDIVDARGVKTTSDIFKFIAVSGTNPKMTVALTVTTDILTAIGVDKKADDVVDLRFLILKKSDMSIVKVVDNGYADETFNDFGTLPDGDYVLGVDIYSTINAGDLNNPVNLTFALQFNQLGMINQTIDYPNVMTNVNACSLYRTYLATVKKAGAAYTILKAVSYMTPPVVTWNGTDDSYPSQVKTTESCTSKTMTGLGFGWMLDYWGEIITSGGTLTYTTSGTTITIPLQKYCKTTWNGAAQPEYSISGTGTIDNSGAAPKWTIKYIFYQNGKSILTAGNGIPAGYLQAVITPKP
jgi:hypothetical protein